MSTVRPSFGGLGALALALLAISVACYPNSDDLRVAHGAGGSGGASGAVGGARMSGGLGGSGSPGAGGRVGAGGSGSGGAGNPQCGAPACAGNLLGTWTYASDCSVVGHSDCGEVIDASGVRRSGTLTFNANGTYSTSKTDTGTFVIDEPAACLGGTTCVQVQAAFAGANSLFSSATCSATTTGCHCLLGALGTQETDTGTYSVSGTSVTMTSSTGTGTVSSDTYCVSGSSLRLIFSDSTPAMLDESLFTK